MARTKVFKSGNSNAVRFPASFAVEPGMTVEVREEHGRWIVEAVPETPKKIDVSGFAGKAPWLKPLPPELREFEERPSTIARRKAEGDA
jgi:antitoxin VapB